MGIGKRIKEAREALKMTQKELADAVGVTASAITNYENGTSHPREEIMYKIFRELKRDPNYFFQDCIDIKKPATDYDDGLKLLDAELFRMMSNLSPEDAELVRAFVTRLKTRKE